MPRRQGQISLHRTRAGVWNRNATADQIPEQHEINQLLARMPRGDREILARMLAEEFVSGVFSALVTLHGAGVPPFDKAYEGTPFHDFAGRLADWEWPNARQRS